MSTDTSPTEARNTLQSISSRPDIPTDVADASIESYTTDDAHIDDETRRIARENVSTETFPLSTYRTMENEHVDFTTRHAAKNLPSSLVSASTEAIEKDLEPEKCSECSGEGTNICDNCDGESRLPCPKGCENGRVTCQNCQGSTRVSCGTCGGDGQEKCSNCSGKGEVNCGHCDYRGKQTCPECKTGWYSGKNKCSTCGGDGTTGTGSSESTCSQCNGDGTLTCQRCRGEGNIACTHCGGSSSEPCRQCTGGTNQCSTCGGSGSNPCSKCADGTLTCSKCGGEGTVPCGCGNGRVDCDTCETEGQVVKAQTASIEYSIEEDITRHTDFPIIEGKLRDELAERKKILNDVYAGQPERDGKWVQDDQVERQFIPVGCVTYSYEGDQYTVYNVNGELHTEQAPESDRLIEVREIIHDQRQSLLDEYDRRVAHLEDIIDGRRETLEDYRQRRNRLKGLGRLVTLIIFILALYGVYLVL